MNVLEMNCLRGLSGVSRIDSIGNEEVHRKAESERQLVSRVDQRVLKWFEHVRRKGKLRMARIVVRRQQVEGGCEVD